MRLKALDQIHVSAVHSDRLVPGQEFECSDELGAALLDRHPATFQRLDAPPPAPKKKAAAKPKNKAEPEPPNKADGAPSEA